MEEIWKDVPGYEGFYQVSNLGRVKSMRRIIYAGNGANHTSQTINERILRQGLQGKQNLKYYAVTLCRDGKVKRCLIHRLVAQAFIPNPNNYPIVNHIDKNPLNNCVDNLEWCSVYYNNNYGTRKERAINKLKVVMVGKVYPPMSEQARKNISEGAKKGWETRRRNQELKRLQNEREEVHNA